MKSVNIFLIAIVVFLGGCTKRIDLDLNNEEFKRLVVEGWFTNQTKAHEVRLSWTSSYFFNEPAPVVSGAAVTISDGANLWNLTEQPVGSGYYYTDPNVAGTIGTDVTLTIDFEGQQWSATDYMNPVSPIDSIALDYIDTGLEPDEDPYYDLLLWTQEPAGVGHHYRWRSLINGQDRGDTLRETSFVDDQLYDGAYVNGLEIDYFEEDEIQSGDTITLEQHGITKEAYDVIIAVLLETDWRGSMFDTAPANVPSNISNGALGFFGAAGVSEMSTVVP